MNLIHKFMIKINVNNLNKIPLNELSWEIIEYALNNGFNYNNAIDDRYEKYVDYVIFNLNSFGKINYSYINKLLDGNNELLKDTKVKKCIMEKIDSIDIHTFSKLFEVTRDADYVFAYKNIDKMEEHDREKIYEVLVEKIDYQGLPKRFIINNTKLGKLYLKSDINNIEAFLNYNNGNYNIDEIAMLIVDNCKQDNIFELLIKYLKTNKVSNDIWKKIIDNFRSDYNRLMILYNNFEELRTPDINNIFVMALKNNDFEITEVNENNFVLIYSLLDNNQYIFLLKNNLVTHFVKFVVEKNINVTNVLDKLCFWCISGKYLLTKESPEWLKSNIELVISSLKNKSISIKDLNLNNFINQPIEKVIEIVNIGTLNNDDESVIEEYKKNIDSKFATTIGTNEQGILCLNINKYNRIDSYDYIISQLDSSVKNIYITGKKVTDISGSEDIQNFDVEKINEIIKIIKKYNKNIKLTFSISSEEIDSKYLEKIIDLEYVVFNSHDNTNSMSGKGVLLINKTLDIISDDINNSNLSPYEKYIAVYNIVKSFKKYKEKDEGSEHSRNIYLILQNDYMVCFGFAKLLESLLKRVGISSFSYGWTKGRHQLNYINIVDEKYGINGIFKSDPTNDNEIIDPINCNYNHINRNIKNEIEVTPFDAFLQSEGEFIDEISPAELWQIDDCATALNSELKSKNGREERLKIFKQNYNNQKEKSIDYSKTIDAIIAVKEYIAGRKFDDKEKRQEKNWIIINSFSKEEKTVGFDNDLVEFKKELFKMKVNELFKMEYSYKIYCFETIINRLFKEYYKMFSEYYSVYISCFNNRFSVFYKNLTQEQQLHIAQYYNNLGIEYKTYAIDGEYNLIVNLKDTFSDIIIGDQFFQKINEMLEGCSLSQEKIMN